MLVIASVFLGFLLATVALSAANHTWPPFLAVESKSMQHSETTSQVGIIDTGDIIVAKKPAGREDVRTYVDSVADDYRSYGDYGDVVVYQMDGSNVPVVHRAIVEVLYNGNGGFDIPELAEMPSELWSTSEGGGQWWDLNNSVELYQVGYSQVTVVIDLAYMLTAGAPHNGLVTMGDNNWYEMDSGRYGIIDQMGLLNGPVPWDHVIGKVTGEIPWLGSIRLWVTGTAPDYLPRNSIFMLVMVLGAIISLPVVTWALASMAERMRRRGGQ
jgi:signal peptidase